MEGAAISAGQDLSRKLTVGWAGHSRHVARAARRKKGDDIAASGRHTSSQRRTRKGGNRKREFESKIQKFERLALPPSARPMDLGAERAYQPQLARNVRQLENIFPPPVVTTIRSRPRACHRLRTRSVLGNQPW